MKTCCLRSGGAQVYSVWDPLPIKINVNCEVVNDPIIIQFSNEIVTMLIVFLQFVACFLTEVLKRGVEVLKRKRGAIVGCPCYPQGGRTFQTFFLSQA